MELTPRCQALIAAVRDGLPLVPRPYEAIGAALGISEEEVIQQLDDLQAAGLVTRFGVVVRHAALGFRSNAMVVWDVPDHLVDEVGARFAALPWVHLSYRRPRRPGWPYNLFTMIHARSRDEVADAVAEMAGIERFPHAVLYTNRRFKQTAAHYGRRMEA